jgi:hypothetical protein
MVQSAKPTSANPCPSDGVRADEIQIAAVQEELEVGVKTTETGAVRIHKIVHEEMQPIPVSLRSQTVEVKRFTVNRPVEHKFEPRQEATRSSSLSSNTFQSSRHDAADVERRGTRDDHRVSTGSFSKRAREHGRTGR